MKRENEKRCPGCGKHCPLSAPRCKYGRAYAAKHALEPGKNGAVKEECKHKWERYVTRNQPLWKMLTVSRRVKKGLCHSQITEQELMAVLTAEQQKQLAEILRRLQSAAEKEK